MHTFLNLLAEAVECHKMTANEWGTNQLAEVMARGDLELQVDFIDGHESYCGWNEPQLLSRFVDGARTPCWDDCDGILSFHRAGWCRTSQSHADMCACGEADDYDEIECGDCMDTGTDPDTGEKCAGTCARMNPDFDPNERHDVEYRAWLASGHPRAAF